MKKRGKRSAASALCAFMLIGLLAGCQAAAPKETTKGETPTQTADTAAQTDSSQTEAPDNVKEPIELTYWVRASSKENAGKATIDEFNESQDRIHVNVESYGDNYSEVLKLAFNSGEAPDLFMTTGIDLKSYTDAGLVSSLNEFLTDDIKAEFLPSAFTVNCFDGQVYAIPDQTRFIRLYYNKDLFEKAGLNPDAPPATLEEMYDMAKQITEAGGGEFYGFGLPIKSGSTWERNVDNIAILGGVTGPCAFDYTTGRFDFSKQKPILEYFSRMYKEGILMPGSESIDIEVMRANFVAGKIGMYLDGNWMVNGYNNEIEGGRDANWDSDLVPIFEGQERARDYLMLDSAIAISAGCEEKAAAFEAMNYYLHNQYTSILPSNPDMVQICASLILDYTAEVNGKPEVQAMKGINGIMKGQEDLAAFPVIPSTLLTLEGDSRDAVYPLLIIQGDSMDIDKELEALSDTYNAALDNALAEGLLTEEEIKPEGFDYRTR